MQISNSNELMLSDALIGPTYAYEGIPILGIIYNLQNISKIIFVIALISLIVAISITKKKDILKKWILLYFISLIMMIIGFFMYNQIDIIIPQATFWHQCVSKAIFITIAIAIRFIMIIYPIYIIRKNKKENK